jgi:peptide/nickel transport system permease protein
MKHKLLNIARRTALMLLVVWTVVSLVTLLIELVPGSPATTILGETATAEQIAAFNIKHGLDRPAFFFSYSREDGFSWNGLNNRYAEYFGGLLHGDLGRSFRTDRPVVDMILDRYPATIKLALASMLVAIGIALPLGVVAGTHKNGILDNIASFIALLGISLPNLRYRPVPGLYFRDPAWLAAPGRKPLSGGYYLARSDTWCCAVSDLDANDPVKRDRRARRGLCSNRSREGIE